MDKINVIKVGGAVVENEASLKELINQFATIPGYKVLVHGGGRSATRIASQLGIESKMVGGRRITDEDMLQVVTMVYGGLVNKRIVASLQAQDTLVSDSWTEDVRLGWSWGSWRGPWERHQPLPPRLWSN